MNSVEIDGPDDPPLHVAVYNVVRENITAAVLEPGMTLNETRLAKQFGTSRMPISRALRKLEAEGIVTRIPGRGFRVAGAEGGLDRDAPLLQIPDGVKELARGQTGWSRIQDRVERELVSCMPFGRYKIIELTMATFFEVSRTVTSELLSRLEERGLIERVARSGCYLPELTPQLMRDLYEVRLLLEPAALRSAFPFIEPQELLDMRDALLDAESRYPDLGIEELDRFEHQLHIKLVQDSPNRRLISALRTSQLPLLATNYLFKRYFGAPTEEPFLAEHRLIIELLIQRAPDAAAAALEAHLLSSLRRGLVQLETLRANHTPTVPLYLHPIKDRWAARSKGVVS